MANLAEYFEEGCVAQTGLFFHDDDGGGQKCHQDVMVCAEYGNMEGSPNPNG
jgi:hypothetical protein